MWSTIKLKTKIIKKRLITCHCHACVGKKWSRYQKKTNPKVKLAFIAVMLVGVAVSAYETKWNPDRWTFTNEPIAESHAQPTNGSSATSPVADTKSPSASGDLVTVNTKATGGAGSPVAPQVEVIEKIKQAFPGEEEIAVAVAMSESHLRSVKGDIPLEYEHQGKIIGHSCGIFQIRVLPGRPSCEELMDVDTNITWAKKLHEKSGWYPWSNYKNGAYKKYL